MLQAILPRRTTPFFRSPLRSFLPRHQSTFAKVKHFLTRRQIYIKVRICQFILVFRTFFRDLQDFGLAISFGIHLETIYSSDCIL